MITLTRVCLGVLIIHYVHCKVAKSVDNSSKGPISLKNPNKIDIVVTVRSGADKAESCQAPGSDEIDVKPLGESKPIDDMKLADDVNPASDVKPVDSSVESLSLESNEAREETETCTETFICAKPGTFPSPNKCSDFYICHKKDEESNAMERIKLSCPKGMTFDKNIKKCTSRTDAACLTGRKQNNH
ncbi:unnamed protein product [Acanthoscelides obtectus]|uniref:Chitin-binding type-2 domain-containing protein n=1 Tax=Acanthoscelides obtectus TaxID=200917 RepID=A0A9P0LZU5_ACAOB|nr:unnamed protein product [Acanthoscelides obtectus]CAK1671152.1 hypothetical protein AOBTE_LOCUS28092 [Acanthoscelides obtectus]